MTVSWPSGRSRSIPLRLFWRAPRISTHPLSGGAVTQGFSAVVEPTEDYPIARTGSQIFERNLAGRGGYRRLAGKPFRDFFPFLEQSLRHIRPERVEELRLAFELRFPFLWLHREQFAQLRIVDVIDANQTEIFPLRDEADRRFVRA